MNSQPCPWSSVSLDSRVGIAQTGVLERPVSLLAVKGGHPVVAHIDVYIGGGAADMIVLSAISPSWLHPSLTFPLWNSHMCIPEKMSLTQ